jgi:hypothetical protein
VGKSTSERTLVGHAARLCATTAQKTLPSRA